MGWTLEALDEAIYSVYRKAYDDNRTATLIRLDPTVGELGALWAEFDRLVAQEV